VSVARPCGQRGNWTQTSLFAKGRSEEGECTLRFRPDSQREEGEYEARAISRAGGVLDAVRWTIAALVRLYVLHVLAAFNGVYKDDTAEATTINAGESTESQARMKPPVVNANATQVGAQAIKGENVL